eukprot:CAMPEP_0185714110 /NCGR_PEP_ID=MMETSP1164-20130828/38141_1 /TAXON_ID=1104430 /ORGANISM="Chrysoreinhardia sp, Strain CCMP2950" /LENGTH=186 /DNA_ID=CAMNT_0028381687 /DNA_START=215 /DNA_END=772 /DNA_ORIENTATION=+
MLLRRRLLMCLGGTFSAIFLTTSIRLLLDAGILQSDATGQSRLRKAAHPFVEKTTKMGATNPLQTTSDEGTDSDGITTTQAEADHRNSSPMWPGMPIHKEAVAKPFNSLSPNTPTVVGQPTRIQVNNSSRRHTSSLSSNQGSKNGAVMVGNLDRIKMQGPSLSSVDVGASARKRSALTSEVEDVQL